VGAGQDTAAVVPTLPFALATQSDPVGDAHSARSGSFVPSTGLSALLPFADRPEHVADGVADVAFLVVDAQQVKPFGLDDLEHLALLLILTHE